MLTPRLLPRGLCPNVHKPYIIKINPLTPELNPSAQRCLARIVTGDFASWTLHFVNVCFKNPHMQQLFIQFINYIWLFATCFGITLPSSGRAFWEMLNWGAVYRTLQMGVLCLVSLFVAMCYMVIIYRRFGGRTCLHLQHKISRPGKTVQENVTAASETGD
jgi:hypothetical protein